jgi:hypothetical protein
MDDDDERLRVVEAEILVRLEISRTVWLYRQHPEDHEILPLYLPFTFAPLWRYKLLPSIATSPFR